MTRRSIPRGRGPFVDISLLRLAAPLALLTALAWTLDPTAAQAEEPAAAPAAPATSPSDAPDPARLRAILQGAPGSKRRVYAHVVDLDSGEVVVDLRGDEAAYPASVAKLFTTAAAVRTFVPDMRLETVVRVHGQKGQRAATVALVGGGDPSLELRDLEKLADAVVSAGIRSVDRLVVDHTLFDDRLPRAFDEKNSDASYRAPIDALEVNGSTIAIAVRPGATAGAPVQVELTPASAAVRINDQAKTGPGRKSTLAVSTRSAGRVTEVLVQGLIGVDRKVIGAGRRRVADAGYFAGETFRAMLEARGVQVGGKTAYAAADPGWKALATHRSEPFDKLLSFCNKWSNNLYAETFYKLLGAKAGTTPSTAEASEAALKTALAQVGVDPARVTLGNGSGLYHATRVPPAQVTALLRGMAAAPEGDRFRATLAVAGVDGTLRGRMKGNATKGKVFAKTGTLDDVTALAGYALGKRRYAFALFFNDVAGHAGPWRRVHDRFLTALLDPTAAEAPAVTPKRVRKARAKPQRARRARRR